MEEKKIFLATHNEGKIDRFKRLLQGAQVEIEIFSPKDFHLEHIDPEEKGKNLLENAEIKARAYFGKVSLPILSNDTGFWVEGEGLIDAPKRKALEGKDEKTLIKEEIAQRMVDFWKEIARKHGGKVDAAWVEAFVCIDQDGTMRTAESRREVVLTDQEFGKIPIDLPVRALYISKVTNKPALEHTKEEEIKEMQPIINALNKVLGLD